MVYVFGIIILFIVIVFIMFFFKYVKLCDIKQSLEISTLKIEETLSNIYNLVNSLISDVDDEKIKAKFNYKDSDSLIDREDVLFETSFDINMYFKNIDNDKKITGDIEKNIRELNVFEEELEGLKDFYNANVLDYDDIFLKKYFNIIFKKMKFKPYKSFKIRKLEEYEIFKN